MAKVLGSVVCTPSTAKTGESICVEVLSPKGKPYDNTESATILINGVPGSKHFLAFHSAGTKNIRVHSGAGGKVEKLVTTVEITARPKGEKPPRLEIGWRPDQPTVAALSILRPPLPNRRGVPEQVFKAKAEKARAKKAGRKLKFKLRHGGGPAKAMYKFDFGNGVTLSSARPHVRHDFGPRLDPNRLHQVFHIKAVIEQPGENSQVIQRSVVVFNPYALLKRRGVIAPPVVSADPSAVFTGTSYHARFAVRNPEPTAIKLTSRSIQLIFDRKDADTRLLPAEKINVTLKANATTEITFDRRKGALPREAEAVAVYYTGIGPGRKPVRFVVCFDIPAHIPAHIRRDRIVSPATVKWLAGLAERGLVADPRRVVVGDLIDLDRQGLLDDKPTKKAGASLGLRPSAVLKTLAKLDKPAKPAKPAKPMSGHMDELPAIEGKECDPWNPPSVVPDGMFCMATSETRTVKMPARFMNARKGDIVLSPSNGSLIGELFRALDPHQPFSHCGIMTRNRDEITHSTAVEDRLTEETFVDSDGVRPDILKYCWPGSITQSVQAAVFGETFVDPEAGKEYTIAGFPNLEGEPASGSADEFTPAMVIKPDPLTETAAIRKALGEIADIALANVGKSHYRFFCFTDPTLGLTDVAPSSAKWAAGTFPSVCSSYVWMAVRKWLKKNNPNQLIEGALEQTDLAAGSQIAEGTPDGLYVYQADERLAAAEVLRDSLVELVNDALSDFEIFISDLDDDLPNQVLNTFATDWADKEAGQSEKWKTTADANAISPTNMLSWDAPLYGFAEPLIFRDARFEEVTIHKWKKVKKTGKIKGEVRFDGKGVAGADVRISATQLVHTDGKGKFVIEGAPEGDSVIEAHKVDANGIFLSAKQTVTVTGNQTTNVVIDLALPSSMFRRLVIDGSQHTINHEFAAAADPHKFKDFHTTVNLGPGSTTHVTKKFNCVADGEVLGQLILTLDLLANDKVKVKTKIRCYDSADENTDDFGEWTIGDMICNPGSTVSASIWVEDDNYAEASFTVTNQVANS